MTHARVVGGLIVLGMLISIQSGVANECAVGFAIIPAALDAETTLPIDNVNITYSGTTDGGDPLNGSYLLILPCGNGFQCFPDGTYTLSFSATGYQSVTLGPIAITPSSGHQYVFVYMNRTVLNPSPPVFTLLDDSGLLLLVIDEKGDVRIRRGIRQNATDNQMAERAAMSEFIVENANGIIKARLTDNGRLFLKNTYSARSSQVVLNGGTNSMLRFRVTAGSTENTVARFTHQGEFQTLGCIELTAPPPVDSRQTPQPNPMPPQ